MKLLAPVDPFGRAPANEIAADLGALITTRKRSMVDKVIMWVLTGGLAAIGATGVVASLYFLIVGPSRLAAALGVAILAPFVWLCCGAFRESHRVIDFHERGVLERCGSKLRTFLYKDITSFTYAINREYLKGIYAGTSQELTAVDTAGRKLKFTGNHKERPKGLAISFLSHRFEGRDELDIVRDIVAVHVATRLTTDLARGPILWAGHAAISPDGLTPRSGRRKGQLVPWSRIVSFVVRDGVFHLYAEGDTKCFACLSTNAPNFYPGLELFLSLRDAAVGDKAAAAARSQPRNRLGGADFVPSLSGAYLTSGSGGGSHSVMTTRVW